MSYPPAKKIDRLRDNRPMDYEAARVSIMLAGVTAMLLLGPGLLLARWLTWSTARAKPWVEALLMLPLLLPPSVLGFYFLQLMGRGSPLGEWLEQVAGLQLVFSFQGLLLASMVVNLPFMVQPIHRAFAAIPHSLREAAWVSGLSGWRTFWKIELPLAWPGLVAGLTLTLAHTLGEFGVVLMVGGSIPGETRTLSVAIYDRVEAYDLAAAHGMAAALLVISLAALGLVFAAQRRQAAGRALQER